MNFIILLLLAFLNFISYSKSITKQLSQADFSFGHTSLFLTKFDFGTQGGSIKIKAIKQNNQIQKQIDFLIDVVIDNDIEKYINANCSQIHNFITKRQQIIFRQKKLKSQINQKISQQTHQHIYYIYMQACYQNYSQFFQGQNDKMIIQITMYNGQSHFGQDQKILVGYLIIVPIWIYLIVKFAMPMAKIIFNSQDQTKITVFAGLIILGVAYFYRLIHLGIYYSNGKGLHFFEILYIILKSACQFIIVTVLVAISWGWSITHLKYDQSYIIAGVTATIINIIGLIVNISVQEMVDTHHKYDSTAGYILQILRVIIVIIFVVGILRSMSLSVGNIRKFIKKFGMVGGTYLISWPLVVIFSEIFLPNYMHNEVITFVEEITHLIATKILCQMLAHPQSTYRKISIKQEDNPLKMQNYKKK